MLTHSMAAVDKENSHPQQQPTPRHVFPNAGTAFSGGRGAFVEDIATFSAAVDCSSASCGPFCTPALQLPQPTPRGVGVMQNRSIPTPRQRQPTASCPAFLNSCAPCAPSVTIQQLPANVETLEHVEHDYGFPGVALSAGALPLAADAQYGGRLHTRRGKTPKGLGKPDLSEAILSAVNYQLPGAIIVEPWPKVEGESLEKNVPAAEKAPHQSATIPTPCSKPGVKLRIAKRLSSPVKDRSYHGDSQYCRANFSYANESETIAYESFDVVRRNKGNVCDSCCSDCSRC